MNANELLHNAIQERIGKENAFFNLLKTAIKNAVDKFALCDTSTSPEVEESVQLSKDRLEEAIRKLKNETVLNKETAKGITDWFSELAHEKNVVQNSHETIPRFPVAAPVPVASATPIVTGAPAPRSWLDRARGVFTRPADTANRAAWNSLAEDPRTLHTNPVFQTAQPVNPYAKSAIGGKRTRKYRRRV